MSLPCNGWKNKNGTSERSCKCGSWKAHWENNSSNPWPSSCCVSDCDGIAEVGAHVINPNCRGEWIVPLCKGYNNRTDTFALKATSTLVSANKELTGC